MLCYWYDLDSGAVARAGRLLAEEDIQKLEEAARDIEALRSGVYHATEDELRAIDEAIAELDRGEVASEADVKAAFAKFRNA